MSRKNTFSRALRHLNQINEQIPTNNTQGLYTIGDPSEWIPPEDNTYTELDFDKDNDIDEGKNTDGLFLSDGTILTVEPPGDTSYVLGPMSSMWYAWGNFTRIGYIRQSDRKMVNLGSITGQLGSWDEETFTSYGQLTLEQAVWFKNIQKKDGGSNDDPNYRAFYPGPPSNTPDEFGRYLCVITGKPKEFGDKIPGYSTSPEQGPGDASDNYSAQKGRDGDRDKDKDDGFDWDKLWDMVDAGLIVLDAISLAGLLFPELGSSVLGGLGLGVVRVLRGLKTVLRGGSTARKLNRRNRIRYEKPKKSNITYDNPSGKPKDPMDKVLRDIDNAGTGPWTSSSYNPNKPGGGPGRKRFGGGESFELQGNTLLEQNLDTVDLPEIIRNLVKDNITSNMKKTSGNLTNKEIEDYMVDRLITLTKDPKFEKNLDKLMSKLDKSKGIKESLTESKKTNIFKNVKKKFEVPEFPKKFKVKPIGRKNKSVGNKMMEIPSVPKEYKPQPNIWQRKDYYKNIRASQETKNQVLELVGAAEHHWTYLTIDRRKEKQEKINEIMSAEFDKSLELMYENYKKNGGKKIDTLVNKLRTNIAPEYPKDPSPTLDPNTGMHPKYGKHYKHDKLDPHSAEAMPSTGNPVIDVNVKKAYDPIKKERKIKNLIGKIKENS